MSSMELIPVTLDEAKAFVRRHRRHDLPPPSWKFGVGLESEGVLVGVAMAGRPVARPLDTRRNIEITRVCTTEERNANSRLYGALCRAAKALGYAVAYSYTLQSESGASLRAAGFEVDEELPARPTWDTPSRRRVQANLFGEETRPPGAKIRWKRALRAGREAMAPRGRRDDRDTSRAPSAASRLASRPGVSERESM